MGILSLYGAAGLHKNNEDGCDAASGQTDKELTVDKEIKKTVGFLKYTGLQRAYAFAKQPGEVDAPRRGAGGKPGEPAQPVRIFGDHSMRQKIPKDEINTPGRRCRDRLADSLLFSGFLPSLFPGRRAMVYLQDSS